MAVQLASGAVVMTSAGPALRLEPELYGWGTPGKKAPTVEVGARFGHLEVVAGDAARHRRDGKVERLVRVRCDCGEETAMPARRLLQGASSCKPCAARRTGRAASRLVREGETVRDLAARLGVTPQAVRLRMERGWSVEDVEAPRRRKAA